MGVSVWYFVETPTGELRRFPTARMIRFHEGREALPEHHPGGVRVAEVVAQLEERRLVRVNRVIWPRFAVTAEGYCDPEHADQALRLAMRSLDLETLMSPENVVGIDARLARQETQRDHRWTPSSAQLQQLANLLNAAADVPPVVAVVGAEVLPV